MCCGAVVSGPMVSYRLIGEAALDAKLTPALVADPIHSFLQAVGAVIVFHGKDNARPHTFTGDLLDAFVITVGPGTIPSGVQVSNESDHALYLEAGTAPHMPPIDAIAPWADAHGISPYAVAYGIAQHGTAAHPFLGPALEQSEAEIDGLLAVAAKEIEAVR